MSNIFFTSDNHFNHGSIIGNCNRPFLSTEEMNEFMIEEWNKSLTNQDIIFHLGDFGFVNNTNILKRLKGRIRLIKGNHDNLNKESLSRFEWVKDYYKLEIENLKIILFHYPIMNWDCKTYNSIHLHGHSHNKTNNITNELRYDVGVDANNFAPISLSQLKQNLNII